MVQSAVSSAAFSLFCFASIAHACPADIVIPNSSDQAQWSELRGFEASKSLNSQITEVQTISIGHGDLNIDFYSISIDADGQTASSLLDEIRLNMNAIIFSGTNYEFGDHDSANSGKWNSSDPVGALMLFTLAQIPNVMPLERGSVVVSCNYPDAFIFSTVTTNLAGLHPVAGNRAFGVHQVDNTLTIYVKAADRVVDRGAFSLLPESGREQIFKLGHDVWTRMLDNLEVRYANRNPRGRFVSSVRIQY